MPALPVRTDRVSVAALATLIGVLAVYRELRRSVIPDNLHFATNSAMIAVVAAVAIAASMTATELGLTRAAIPKGLRYGLVVIGIVAVVVAIAGFAGFDPTNSISDRADLTRNEMLFQVFVEIPIATVLFEELAFRGVIAGLFERLVSAGWALFWTAVVFGLWHVSPVDVFSSRIGDAAATVAATAVAGAVFHLLKRRSASLVAPLLAHWATNGVSLAIAWLFV